MSLILLYFGLLGFRLSYMFGLVLFTVFRLLLRMLSSVLLQMLRGRRGRGVFFLVEASDLGFTGCQLFHS
jgi:hypothetical protein